MLDGVEKHPDELAFTGPSVRLAPNKQSAWLNAYYEPRKNSIKDGEYLWDTSTSNIWFNRELFSPQGYNLRFDMAFNFSGSEDSRLFFQMKDLGIGIAFLNKAIIKEPTIEERATFKKTFIRNVSFAQNMARINNLRFPHFLTPVWNLFIGSMELVNVVTFSLVGTIIILFNTRFGLSFFVRAYRSAAIGCGNIKSVFTSEGTFYKETDGY